MPLRIETADLGLASLDALEVDALAVPVGPGRPLQGLAAFVDWRLCGTISRAVRAGLFATEAEEALLVPTGGRLRVSRVFCFGLAREPLDAAGFAAAARRVCGDMARAGRRVFPVGDLRQHQRDDDVEANREPGQQGDAPGAQWGLERQQPEQFCNLR